MSICLSVSIHVMILLVCVTTVREWCQGSDPSRGNDALYCEVLIKPDDKSHNQYKGSTELLIIWNCTYALQENSTRTGNFTRHYSHQKYQQIGENILFRPN